MNIFVTLKPILRKRKKPFGTQLILIINTSNLTVRRFLGNLPSEKGKLIPTHISYLRFI